MYPKKLDGRTVTHNRTECDVYVARYQEGGRLAIELVDREDGMPYTRATVNLPDDPLGPDEVFVKDYAENEGVLDALEAAGLVKRTGRVVDQGYVKIPVAKILFNEAGDDPHRQAPE